MPAAHCPICLSHLPINDFVIFPCGHGVCIDCKSGMFQESERPNCPNCRLRIRDRDAHPLFLELVDSKESKDAFISNLVENIDKMDQETPLSSVKRAGNKLTMVLQDPQLMAESLAMAIEDFSERIVPLFTKVQVLTHENIALREDSLESREENESLRDQLTRAERNCNQLEIELNETKKNENEAIRLATIAKDDLHESSLQWKKRTSELTAENQWCKDILEKLYQDILEPEKNDKVEPARLQRQKLKKLQKQERHKLAAKEETVSDTAWDCDGEFSAHEHSMMRNSSLNTSASSRTASRRFRLQDENHIGLSRQLNKSNYGARLGSIPPNIMDTDLRSAYLNSNTGRVTKVVQLRPHPHPMILLSR